MKRLQAAIVAYFVVYATALAFLQPPLESPDEVAHLAYINFVSRTWEIPNQFSKEKAVAWEGHQPPLYYFLGAALVHAFKADRTLDLTPVPNCKHFWHGGRLDNVPVFHHVGRDIFATPMDRALYYSLRLLSVALGAATLIYVLKLSRLFFGNCGWVIWPAFFVATLPQFAFISAMVNNDNLANFLAAAALCYLFRVTDRPAAAGNYLLLGLSMGLGLLAKKTLLFLLPGSLLILGCLAVQDRAQSARVIRNMVLTVLIAGLICGWWFVRNHNLYGDLLGARMERETMPTLVAERPFFSTFFFGKFASDVATSLTAVLGVGSEKAQSYHHAFLGSLAFIILAGGLLSGVFLYLVSRQTGESGRAFAWWAVLVSLSIAILIPWLFFHYLFGPFVEALFLSFIALVGYMTIGLPHALYSVYAFVFLLAGIGLCWRLLTERFRDLRLVGALILVLSGFAGVIQYSLTYSNPQGRWLFPALALLAVLSGIGLQMVISHLGTPRVRLALIGFLAAAFVVGDLMSLFIILIFYHNPQVYG
jgi:4-amino-4-deoxy-L-arabinose transferase-like glycosyltransferase